MPGSCAGSKALSCWHGSSRLQLMGCSRRPDLGLPHPCGGPLRNVSRSGAPYSRALAASVTVPTLSSSLHGARYRASAPASRVQQLSLDRDVVVSVLEAAATKRDAKGYLQKYAAAGSRSDKKAVDPRGFVLGALQAETEAKSVPNVAIMNLRAPQKLDQGIIHGIAKTLIQLRFLGLLTVVVLDCGLGENRLLFQEEIIRLCEAIDSFGKPSVKVAEDVLTQRPRCQSNPPSECWDDIRIDDGGLVNRALQHGMIVVIPSLAREGDTSAPKAIESNRTILALTRYFTGFQFDEASSENRQPGKSASVERIILLDQLGGTPVPGRPGACQRFVNLEQEYEGLLKKLLSPGSASAVDSQLSDEVTAAHATNLTLAKDALSLLPESSSALITTPFAAANISSDSKFGYDGMVTTRKKHNPLLHNLLTDKPAYSSSLPIERIQVAPVSLLKPSNSIDATLLKRGMPLTIFPNPMVTMWSPPKPGGPRVRLTDACIDLPRLVNLIEDSFGRKLDLTDYLNRVNENLAGIIIAGEYEGGAILTWEKPDGMTAEEAYETGRFVPYLDKFAVLRSRQGSGGVADIIFNAMVRDCFPRGVCWRSRKNNPVNKWYFERSIGTVKLSDSNWTMFWTTVGLDGRNSTLGDYEAVCRGVVPSWADNHHILD